MIIDRGNLHRLESPLQYLWKFLYYAYLIISPSGYNTLFIYKVNISIINGSLASTDLRSASYTQQFLYISARVGNHGARDGFP